MTTSIEDRLRKIEGSLGHLHDLFEGHKTFRIDQRYRFPSPPDPSSPKAWPIEEYKRIWPDRGQRASRVTILSRHVGIKYVYDGREIPLVGDSMEVPQFIKQDLMEKGYIYRDASYKAPRPRTFILGQGSVDPEELKGKRPTEPDDDEGPSPQVVRYGIPTVKE